MESGGPFAFGDIPDDTDGPGEEDVAHRGWIAPEDRLWRHPSELSRRAAMTFDHMSGRNLWRERRGAVVVGTVGAAAVAAAAAVILVFANVSTTAGTTGPVHASETSLVTAPTVSAGIMRAVSALRPSLVALVPAQAGAHGTRAATNTRSGGARDVVTGVVLPGGSLVVTAASGVAGVGRADVLTSNGRRLRATVVATDESSGVAVLSVPGALAAAAFADEPVYPGQVAVTACLHAGSPRTQGPQAVATVSVVRDAGRMEPPGKDGSRLMDAIEADNPGGADRGGVLLDGHGRVIGILDAQKRDGTGSFGVFIPGSLALDVAHELASDHRIDRGWIGVTTNDAPGRAGAEIDDVFAGSPAAASGIEPGDVVTAIDGHSVQSYADLEARLYAIQPGRQVELSLERSGSQSSVSLVLAARAGS